MKSSYAVQSTRPIHSASLRTNDVRSPGLACCWKNGQYEGKGPQHLPWGQHVPSSLEVSAWRVHPLQSLSWDKGKIKPWPWGEHSYIHSRTGFHPFHSYLLDPMSWGPNTLHNLESRRSYANLRASTPPRTVSSSRSPCAQHTCPHTAWILMMMTCITSHHHQNSRSIHQKPSKRWDFS